MEYIYGIAKLRNWLRIAYSGHYILLSSLLILQDLDKSSCGIHSFKVMVQIHYSAMRQNKDVYLSIQSLSKVYII